MNYKILQKIIIAFLVLIAFMNVINIKSFSADTLDSIVSDGDSFISASANATDKLDTTEMKNISNTLYNVLLSFGIIIAVVFATILGVQYMTAAAENKAQIKESLIPFFVGCIVVFGAFAIWKAIILILT